MHLDLRKDTDIKSVLREHAAQYPAMTPVDVVKLIYQATFGVEHLLTDQQTVMTRLAAEEKDAYPSLSVPAENIGGGFARVYLGHEIPIKLLGAMFLDASQTPCGTEVDFMDRLTLLRALTAEETFSFGTAELEAYLTDYLANGVRAVSHSELYRTTYHPVYRVVSRDMAILLPMLIDIYRKVAEKGSAILALDGFCASGKTTLAKRLANIFDARVIHMDDFFLPLEKRTPERFAEAGGNVDYERFYDEVVTHLSNESLTYGVFDCTEMKVTHQSTLAQTPVTIIEGAYAMHPHFGMYADTLVFMETDSSEQQKRILARNGEEKLTRFVKRWIPFEQKYEKTFAIRQKCAYLIQT